MKKNSLLSLFFLLGLLGTRVANAAAEKAAANTSFKLSDLVFDMPTILIAFGLLGTLYTVARTIVNFTNKARDIKDGLEGKIEKSQETLQSNIDKTKDELEKSDSIAIGRLDNLSYVFHEDSKRLKEDYQVLKLELREIANKVSREDYQEIKLEVKELRSKVSNLEGYMTKHGYIVRDADRWRQ